MIAFPKGPLFPTVSYEDLEQIALELEQHAGVFLEGHPFTPLANHLASYAGGILRALPACPPLEAKTMFPESLQQLPDAKRNVLQVYGDPLRRPEKEDPRSAALRDILGAVMEELADYADNVLTEILHHYEIGVRLPAELRREDEWSLNVAHYPCFGKKKGDILFPAHKDWGLLALYPATPGPGLEVEDTRGETVKLVELVVPPKMMFLYAGDILRRVTSGKIRPLLHRVVAPFDRPPLSCFSPADLERVGTESGRTSMIFYVDPPRDVVLEDGMLIGEIIDSKLRKIGQIT